MGQTVNYSLFPSTEDEVQRAVSGVIFLYTVVSVEITSLTSTKLMHSSASEETTPW